MLDRGLGLDDADTARLFSPFYRSAEAQRTASGLGTRAARLRPHRHGARRPHVGRPRDGGGAEFGFALPLAPTLYETE